MHCGIRISTVHCQTSTDWYSSHHSRARLHDDDISVVSLFFHRSTFWRARQVRIIRAPRTDLGRKWTSEPNPFSVRNKQHVFVALNSSLKHARSSACQTNAKSTIKEQTETTAQREREKSTLNEKSKKLNGRWKRTLKRREYVSLWRSRSNWAYSLAASHVLTSFACRCCRSPCYTAEIV